MNLKITLDDGRVLMWPHPDIDPELGPDVLTPVEPWELDVNSFAIALDNRVLVRGLDGYQVMFATPDGGNATGAAAAIRHIIGQVVELANRQHVELVR